MLTTFTGTMSATGLTGGGCRTMPAIDDQLTIPDSELRYSTSRSGGPGGQNVNKLETKVTLEFEIAASAVLSEEQKTTLAERLATRINREGVLRVTSQKYRSQIQNRDAAIARFIELVHDALQERPKRKPTRVPRGAKKKRLEEKKKRSELKRLRGSVDR